MSTKRPTQYELEVFQGFGTQQHVVIIGRVHRFTPLEINENSHIYQHIWYIIREYLARPFSKLEVSVTLGKSTASAYTDNTGMFYAHVHSPQVEYVDKKEWYEVEATIVGTSVTTRAEVLIEDDNNSYGIISDIDDTVLVSHATNKLKLLYLTFLKGVDARELFTGVVELYQDFKRGPERNGDNPIFYVSSSHWSLYHLLQTIFSINRIPRGILLLKKVTNPLNLIWTIGKHEHKKDKIKMIIDTYPKLPFILIGDSGQHDPDIYKKITEEYPEQIKAVYIRNVTPDQTIKPPHFLHAQTFWLVAKSSREIREHAKSIGLL